MSFTRRLAVFDQECCSRRCLHTKQGTGHEENLIHRICVLFFLNSKQHKLKSNHSTVRVTILEHSAKTRSLCPSTGDGGKPIIKIRKLNQRLLRRRENAVQRTPPRAHPAGADYGIYNVLNKNAEDTHFSAFQCTT